jgi:hypothetical protein
MIREAQVLDLNQMDAVWAGTLLVVVGSVPETISSSPTPPQLGAPDPKLLNTVSIYDPGARSWRSLHPVPASPSVDFETRVSPLAAVGDLVWLFGGSTEEYLFLDTVGFKPLTP